MVKTKAARATRAAVSCLALAALLAATGQAASTEQKGIKEILAKLDGTHCLPYKLPLLGTEICLRFDSPVGGFGGGPNDVASLAKKTWDGRTLSRCALGNKMSSTVAGVICGKHTAKSWTAKMRANSPMRVATCTDADIAAYFKRSCQGQQAGGARFAAAPLAASLIEEMAASGEGLRGRVERITTQAEHERIFGKAAVGGMGLDAAKLQVLKSLGIPTQLRLEVGIQNTRQFFTPIYSFLNIGSQDFGFCYKAFDLVTFLDYTGGVKVALDLLEKYSGGLWRQLPHGPLTEAQTAWAGKLGAVGAGWSTGGLLHLDQYISSLGKYCISYSLDLGTDDKRGGGVTGGKFGLVHTWAVDVPGLFGLWPAIKVPAPSPAPAIFQVGLTRKGGGAWRVQWDTFGMTSSKEVTDAINKAALKVKKLAAEISAAWHGDQHDEYAPKAMLAPTGMLRTGKGNGLCDDMWRSTHCKACGTVLLRVQGKRLAIYRRAMKDRAAAGSDDAGDTSTGTGTGTSTSTSTSTSSNKLSWRFVMNKLDGDLSQRGAAAGDFESCITKDPDRKRCDCSGPDGKPREHYAAPGGAVDLCNEAHIVLNEEEQADEDDGWPVDELAAPDSEMGKMYDRLTRTAKGGKAGTAAKKVYDYVLMRVGELEQDEELVAKATDGKRDLKKVISQQICYEAGCGCPDQRPKWYHR